MKLLTSFFVLVVGSCLIQVVAAAPLSPPTIDAPLYTCATTVSVKGFVPGAKISIFVGGATQIGGGVSDSPWGQVFAVSPPLTAGQVVTAKQTFGSDTSGPSPALTVASYGEKLSSRLARPVVSAPLYECGGALAVTNLAKGGFLRVYADSQKIGQVDGCGDGQWLRVTPLLTKGQSVTADEKLCSSTTMMSAAVSVDPTPMTLPALTIGDIYEGGKYCVIDGITNGALVMTYNGGSVVDKGYYPGGGQVVRLTPPPNAGDTITATQSLCSTMSPPSPPTVVQPCSSLPPPALSPICPGDGKVGIAKAVIDARIQVYADGILVADGGGPVVNLFSPAKAGQNYTATQSLGSCVSNPSSPLAVGCVPPNQIPVGIGPGGRAVAIGVDTSDSKNITVASETGGLFRSSDRGVHWSHVSGATTFGYTDVTYVPGSPKVIVATASQDTRTVSGGGIWRSNDGGTNWIKPNLAYPTVDCRENAAAYALATEKETKKIWAGTRCGLAYSDNAGATWTYLSPVSGYNYDTTYAVLAPDNKRLVILTPSGVKVSKDSGASFTLSNTGLPSQIVIGTHNQIAVPRGNRDHIYWAFNYWLLVDAATNDWKGHIALYRSTDFGATWAKVIDTEGINRPPFVRIANSLSGESGKYDVYFGDGGCSLQRASAGTGVAAGVSSWTSLNFDHCDPADLAFDTDNRTPLLLASDGGLHVTKDSGSNWTLAGSGPYGYNALQITEVIGQFQKSGSNVDLYFATQDNSIWASPDTGASWTANRCCEGFFLNIPRAYYPSDKTKLTGVACAGCGNFISDRLLANQQGFPNPPNDNGNPRLLKPGYYIHNTADPANPGSTFVLTTDTGASWNSRYFFSEEVRDLSQISGPVNDPVVYTPKKSPGTTPDNQEVVQLKRIEGVLGAGASTVSDVGGVKGMGIFPTMFAWYKVFGVDPRNPNYLMVPDTVDRVVKVSTDAGGSWTDDNLLTSSVTQGDEFKFYWAPFTQVSTIGVDPDCKGHVLVGTQQTGIFTTYNSGATWGRVAGTEVIPFVSRFFFKGGGEVIASSYGRGLWKLKYTCPTHRKPFHRRPPFRLREPVLFWKGAMISLSQITPQRPCKNCAFVLAKNGSITDYSLDPKTHEIRAMAVDRGRAAAYTFGGTELKVPIRVASGRKQGGFSGDRELIELLSDEVRVKGLFVEGKVLRGVLLSSDDVKVPQLPRVQPPASHITVERKDQGRIEIGSGPIRISGKGFDRKHRLEVLLDGTPLDVGQGIRWKSDDEFVIWIPSTVGIGGHTVVVRQKTEKGVIEDATTFLITVSDRDEAEESNRKGVVR